MQNYLANDCYWVIDFDRCLGNVDTLFNHYMAILRDHHAVDLREIIAARKKTEASKGSFDLIGYLLNSGSLTEGELQQVGVEFIKRSAGDSEVLMPGAQKFLEYLKTQYDGRYGIMTFGNPYWQRLKIAAAGLNEIPCIVVDSSHKARQIASWYDTASARYLLPQPFLDERYVDDPIVREVILVDDKLVAFDGMHEKTRGYLVSQEKDNRILIGNDRVKQVGGLEDMVNHEGARGVH